jgi:hypothetical protein
MPGVNAGAAMPLLFLHDEEDQAECRQHGGDEHGNEDRWLHDRSFPESDDDAVLKRAAGNRSTN